jgi:ATP-dependent RNA helicase SUPV3L1/SUV3
VYIRSTNTIIRKCRRVIFQTLIKGARHNLQRISIPHIKQIGGRAGRFRAANEKGGPKDSDESNVGLVTCLEDIDLPHIQRAMEFEPAPLTAAGMIPTDTSFQRIAPYFPAEVSFKFLVNRVWSLAQTHPLFFMCKSRAQVGAAEIIDRSAQLGVDDRLIFMAAPINDNDPVLQKATRGYIRALATNNSGRLLDIPEINLEILEIPVSGNREYLHGLESLHKSLILYLWLSYRVGGVFTDRTLAMHAKTMVEERMMRALAEFSANKKLRRDSSLRRQILLEKRSAEQQRLLSATEGSNEAGEASANAFDMRITEDAPSGNGAQLENSVASV